MAKHFDCVMFAQAICVFLLIFHAHGLRMVNNHPIVQKAIGELKDVFHSIDMHTLASTKKLLTLYKEEEVDAFAFHGVDGYGHGDVGREKFDNIIAKLLGAEKALVRVQFFSGTHAISTALFATLRPGDEFLSVSGNPYDTLEEVIGLRSNEQTNSIQGSLKDWNIGYNQLPLIIKDDFSVQFNLQEIESTLNANPKIKLIHIQRSCGYQWRPSIPVSEIGRLCEFVQEKFKSRGREIIVFCDNCYGELVEEIEPLHVGADLIAGSLIKNLGGTLAPCGGYVAGKEELVNAARVRLSAPGVDGGATLNQYRHLFQGLFMAPGIVGESLKGAALLANVMGKQLGYPCNPPVNGHRTDIVQAIQLQDRKKLIAFCETVQRNSPVGSYIQPCPGLSPGYGTEVIFADGTFIDGSTLELSADGPLREPFVAFSQGATHWTHWAIVLNELLSLPEFSTSSSS